MPEAGMMVENSCYTVADGINIGSISTEPGLLQRKMPVDRPPLSIQNIQKTRWIVPLNRKPSGKGAVNVLMCINKCRHDQATFCINVFCPWTGLFYFFRIAYHVDRIAIYGHCPIFKEYVRFVPCDHSSITNNKHIYLLLFYLTDFFRNTPYFIVSIYHKFV